MHKWLLVACRVPLVLTGVTGSHRDWRRKSSDWEYWEFSPCLPTGASRTAILTTPRRSFHPGIIPRVDFVVRLFRVNQIARKNSQSLLQSIWCFRGSCCLATRCCSSGQDAIRYPGTERRNGFTISPCLVEDEAAVLTLALIMRLKV